MEDYVLNDDNYPPFGSFVVEARIHASKPNLQEVEGARTSPKDNGKNKAIMSGRSPSPSKNRFPWNINKFLPKDIPPRFPT
jgi:hypothetical protein